MLDRVVPVDLQLGELADSLLGDLGLETGSGLGGESNTVGMLDSAAHRPADSERPGRGPGAASPVGSGPREGAASALNGLFSTAPRAEVPRHWTIADLGEIAELGT